MKKIILITLLLLMVSVNAQQKDTTRLYYKPRYYNLLPCGCSRIMIKDSTYIKKDSLIFVYRKTIRKYYKA
ncbi:hypothetical protein C8C83_0674 [Flavobacterium sp. 90]|uniref:hypothetical protein n=1 Tax=unclassified Flavobacterium TaxID=196869 RepID=UPI000EB144D5|nr:MULTISPECIES: hypothetical protein [unclassified Flavobacterium]RKR09074.1 hypothetical protein C8C82_0972 [Flavobacterium sp. 81]TCK52858.1 hypothetical protein C8C83_0674 [Flavobacterium sp. 90]